MGSRQHIFANSCNTCFRNRSNTYFSVGHVVEGFGQTVPVGLAAEQTVHDDDRWFPSTVGGRLVRCVRHFDGFQFGAQRPPGLLQQARHGQKRFGVDHGGHG